MLAVSLAMEKCRSFFNALAGVAVPARTTLLVIWKGNYSRFESWLQVVGIVLRVCVQSSHAIARKHRLDQALFPVVLATWRML